MMAKAARQPSVPDQVGSGTHRLNRRRLTRVPIELAVTIEFADGRQAAARATDIGLGGMFVESNERPGYADSLTVHALLPGADGPSRLPAIVRWVTDHGFGVQFGLLTARETHAIAGIIRDAAG
jgi:PilZ domain